MAKRKRQTRTKQEISESKTDRKKLPLTIVLAQGDNGWTKPTMPPIQLLRADGTMSVSDIETMGEQFMEYLQHNCSGTWVRAMRKALARGPATKPKEVWYPII